MIKFIFFNFSFFKKLKLYILFFLLSGSVHAQIPVLERVIKIQANNETIESLLLNISKQANFNFSYNPEDVPVNSSLSISENNKTVREIIELVFQGEITYKARGNHVILVKKSKATNKRVVVSGYIIDNVSGQKIPMASIYEKNSLISTVSDQFGFYKVKLPYKNTNQTIIVKKKSYQTQQLNVNLKENTYNNFFISTGPVKKIELLELQKVNLKIENITLSNFALFGFQQIHNQNIIEPIYRKYQVSFVPFIGSNHFLGGNAVNDYSFNLLAGYTAGVSKSEIAGLANLVKGDVHGFQAAGLFNFVGKNVNAIQLAGLGNIVYNDARGIQLAGLGNMVWGNLNGLQLAGLFNFNNLQSEGIKLAGLFNLNLKSHKGIMIAGIININKDTLEGAQVASVFNYSKLIKKGAQFGLLNYADSVSKGIPIGILSFVRKGGYRRYEIGTDEMLFINFTFKTGVKKFYNILTTGIYVQNFSSPVWTVGYGFGRVFSLKENLVLNVDITSNHISKNNFSLNVNSINKLTIAFEKKISKHVSFSLGPSFNIFITDYKDDKANESLNNLPPYTIIDTEEYNNNYKAWIGGQLSIRFL